MINKLLMLVFIVSTTVLFTNCSEKNTTQPSPKTPSNVPLSKLSDTPQKVFTQTLALSNRHGSANTQANFLLTEGNSFANLVNVQSVLFPQFNWGSPDSSSNSLLIKILRGEVAPQMPLN